MTIEIPQDCWVKFCGALSQKTDALMDIRTQVEGDLRLVAQSVRLRSFAYEVGDACNSTLIIAFGAGAADARRHCVIEPIRLILRKEGGGDHYNLLEVPSENGTAVISFRPGIAPALLTEAGIPVPPAAAGHAA